ncbi:hypothetical protein NE237_012821 [Protea cynaroides]|uniref:Uncharacterized protein n=1 Tax=Protea cynaroides TaxID=273540 RepID=A0A9Q0GY68_9MAGN|nr:hypothetical protein NE237_012821 [Protea cynaroides]
MWNRVFLSGFLILAFLIHANAISHHHPHHHNHHHHHHDHSAVLDTDGHELQAGKPYYIVSAIRGGAGGGVSIGRTEISTSHGYTLTPTVKQSSYDMNMGTPVLFFPESSQNAESSAAGVRFLGEIEEEEMTIKGSKDMNIRFSGMNDTVWQVEERRQHSSGSRDSTRYVTLRGQPGHPGKSTVRNWFKIERMSKSNPFYRIVYCPNVCESCHVVCGRVGITKEDGNRLLTVSEHREFPFVFIRAQSTQ